LRAYVTETDGTDFSLVMRFKPSFSN